MPYPTRPELETIRTTHRFKTESELQSEYGESWRIRTPGFHSNFDSYLGKTIGKVNIKETADGVRLIVRTGNVVTMELLTERGGVKKVPKSTSSTAARHTEPKTITEKPKAEDPKKPVRPVIDEDMLFSQTYDTAMRKYIVDLLMYHKVIRERGDVQVSYSNTDTNMRVTLATGSAISWNYSMGNYGTQTCCGFKEFGPFNFNGSAGYSKDTPLAEAFHCILELAVRAYVRNMYNGGNNEKRNKRNGCFATILPDQVRYQPIKAVFEEVDFMIHADSFNNSNSNRDIEVWVFSYGDMFSK